MLVITIFLAKQLEKTALNFIKSEVRKEIHQKLDRVVNPDGKTSLGLLMDSFFKQYQDEVPLLKKDVEMYVNEISDYIASHEQLDTTRLEKSIALLHVRSKLWEYESVKRAIGAIGDLVQDRYQSTWRGLLTDIQVFSAANIASFALILVLCYLVNEVPHYLLFCSWILVASTLCCIFLYVYGQDWFYTIIYNDFWGTGYICILTGMFCYLLFRFSVDYLFWYVRGKN